jgi:hypothetical protein
MKRTFISLLKLRRKQPRNGSSRLSQKYALRSSAAPRWLLPEPSARWTATRALPIACVLVVFPQSHTPAAVMTTLPTADRVNRFAVEGALVFGDEKEFARRVSSYSDGVVVLNSNGGNMFAGVEIGRIIREKGFKTEVPVGGRCASACALAWLGGQPRFMTHNGQIGFHAAFIRDQGVERETGAGNAIVGAYLRDIGLSMNAIIFVTGAPPHGMRWLTFEDAADYNIPVRPGSYKFAQPNPSEPRRQVPSKTDPQSTGSIAPLVPDREIPASFVPPIQHTLANLLDVAVSAAVQDRLRQLGYFSGVQDGLWGPRSRIALRDFKRNNGMLANDAWDLDTQTLLNSTEAVPAPSGYNTPQSYITAEGLFEPFLPVRGTTLHPLNPDDAQQIQERLSAFGYYRFPPGGIWGTPSRNALREFKGINGLRLDDVWDSATERALIGRRMQRERH